MITWLRDFIGAFLWDALAFKRWMRAAGAGVALVIFSVVQMAGTDVPQAIAVLKTWTLGDWAVRLALGFLFSSVHAPRAAPLAGAPDKTTP